MRFKQKYFVCRNVVKDLSDELDIFPTNQLFSGFDKNLLNGLVNIISKKPPVAAVVLNFFNRPETVLKDIGNFEYTVFEPTVSTDESASGFSISGFSDHPFPQGMTKLQALQLLMNPKVTKHWTPLRVFEDRVALIFEVGLTDQHGRKIYWFMDYSPEEKECQVGRFATTESTEQIIQDFHAWADDLSQDKQGMETFALESSFFDGWLKF